MHIYEIDNDGRDPRTKDICIRNVINEHCKSFLKRDL